MQSVPIPHWKERLTNWKVSMVSFFSQVFFRDEFGGGTTENILMWKPF